MPPNELDNQLSPIRNRLSGVEHQAENRVFLPCEAEHVHEVCRFLFQDLGLRFVISTGIDAEDCFEVLHHFSDDSSGCLVTVKAFVRDRAAPALDSITPLIPGAEWIEREMHDLLGIEFRHHPNLQRLILADDWPAGVYPLRKEGAEKGEVSGVKHEVEEDKSTAEAPDVRLHTSTIKHRTSAKSVLAVGPFHPLQEEMEFFQLTVEGEKVTDIDARISYNHRGIEKLSETLQFDQVPFLVSRVCGICSASHPLAYVQAVEEIAGIKPPERALYVRTIINELERIHSHLLWVGLGGHFIGYDTVFMWAWKYREPVLDLLEEITGNRNNYGNVKVGGCREDIPDELIPKINRELDGIEQKTEMLTKAVLDDPVLHARLKGVGVLKKEDAIRYAVTGPTARGSGIAVDVRHDDPYAAYGDLDWKVISQPEGDVFAKAVVRLLETFESIKMVRQALARLPKGPVAVEVKEIPPGEGCGHAEAPRGETFHYVRSDGGNRPVRHKIRAPSYVNVPSFKASCLGADIADVTLTLAAVDPCYSCTERIAVVDGRHNVIRDYEELLRLSRARTAQIRKELGAPEMKLEGL